MKKSAEKNIKVYFNNVITAATGEEHTVFDREFEVYTLPVHCKGFGKPDEKERGCYGDQCPNTEICKMAAVKKVTWTPV